MDGTDGGQKLICRNRQPFNAEPPLPLLVATVITPEDAFFVRTHGTAPRLDAGAFRLRISGRVARPQPLSLDDMRRRFALHTVVATVQCAGNRRVELASLGPVDGMPWRQGAIGNAEWTGFRLADLLADVGCAAGDLHVAFNSCDECEEDGERFAYGGSIPLAKASAPEVLLAIAMNGRPLTADHGAPLRALVPGYLGARSVKWLAEVIVQDRPSENFYQQRDYKRVPPEATAETVDWSRAPMLGELPVNSVICAPADGAALSAGVTEFRGYAIAGGRRGIRRVELSADAGASWTAAQLEPAGEWAWTLWRASLHLKLGPHRIVVRATDSAGETQPADLRAVWNFRGYVNNAWHAISVTAG
jgi:sulfite oxidase